MDRRRFLLTSLASALAAPLAAEAQSADKVWRIGVLSFISLLPGEAKLEAFKQGLRDHGYVEGQNLSIEYRSSEGKDELLPAMASELVKQATRDIPIVMQTVLDPIGAGFVPSLARPGGNVTGLSELSAELSAKRLELLKQAVPGTSTVAVLVDRNHPTNALELNNTESAARRLGFGIVVVDVPAGGVFDDVFAE